MSTTLSDLYQLVSEAEIEKALQKLQSMLSMAGSELVNDAVLLSAQHKKLLSDSRKGIIDFNQENLAFNRINNGILSLLDELKDQPAVFAQFSKMETDMENAVMERSHASMPEVAKDALFLRMAYVREKKLAARALWIDDTPDSNRFEWGMLESVGLQFERAASSQEALEKLQTGAYDLVISDVARENNPREGLDFLQGLPENLRATPFLFYVGRTDRSRGVPPYAFGIADMPDELAHLTLDVLERKY
jgi:CheY-like chemotaxis protein